MYYINSSFLINYILNFTNKKKVNKTISILTTSTNLITSITNLNYHYTTTPSFNSSRKLTDQIIWKPNQPEEAIKSWETLRLKRSKDESYKMGEEVILTLQRDFKRAESEGGILLGSIDEKS